MFGQSSGEETRGLRRVRRGDVDQLSGNRSPEFLAGDDRYTKSVRWFPGAVWQVSLPGACRPPSPAHAGLPPRRMQASLPGVVQALLPGACRPPSPAHAGLPPWRCVGLLRGTRRVVCSRCLSSLGCVSCAFSLSGKSRDESVFHGAAVAVRKVAQFVGLSYASQKQTSGCLGSRTPRMKHFQRLFLNNNGNQLKIDS